MNVFDLMAKIGLDTSEYESKLAGAKEKLSSVGGAIKGGIGAAAKVASAAISVASDAAISFGKSAVQAGMTFDSSMSQVAATMGKTVDEISDLRDFAQEMGSTTAFSASQAADALNYMALAGYDASTSMDMLPTVLDLAAAGGIELATASDMVTDASSALGLSIDETKVMIDQMAVASSKTNTSVAQLGDAILTVGGTAKNLRGGTQELTQVLGLMADNGIKAGEAGTHLRNIMLAMNPQTNDAVAAFEKLGLQTYDDSGKLRNMSDIFGDLSDKMSGMSDLEKTDLLTKIFNKTDLSAVNALLDTSAERWQEVSDAIGDYDGAASQMANTQLDNLAGDITLFQSALEGAQIAVSDGLTPTLREFVQFGSEGLSSLTEAFKKNGVAGAIGELGNILVKAVKTFLPKLLDTAKTIIKTLIDGIKQNKDSIAEIAKTIIDFLVSLLTDDLPELLVVALDLIMMLSDGLIQSLPELIPAIIEIVLKIVEMLTNEETLVALIDASLLIIQAIAEGLMNALPQLLNSADRIVTSIANAIIKSLPKLVDVAVNIIAMIAGTLIANLGKILDIGTQIIFKLVEGIASVFVKLYEYAVKGVDYIKEGFSEGVEAAKEWGKDLIDNFIGGIKAKWENLKSTVSDVAQSVKDFLGFSEPKKGPLSNFHTYAPDMMDLFAKGIKDNTNKITGQLEMSLTDVKGTFEPSQNGYIGGYGGGNVFNINIASGTISNDYDAYRAAQLISEQLANLQSAQSIALGGIA